MDTPDQEGYLVDQQKSSFLQNLIKKLRTRRGIVIGIVVLFVIGFIGLYAYSNKDATKETDSEKPFSEKPTDSTVIAKVGTESIYQKDLDAELASYPGTKSASLRKKLLDKIITDSIILQAAGKDKMISLSSNIYNSSSKNYLDRTESVEKAKSEVAKNADGISGQIVSIWFYNNGYIGSQGLEKGKQIAFEKITRLYQRVKNKEITIQQAGELIAADKSLVLLDPAYAANSYITIKENSAEKITFWPKFDEMLRKLKPGELTQIYIGQDTLPDGKVTDALYLFGQVDSIQNNAGFDSYDDWLAQNKKEYEVIYY